MERFKKKSMPNRAGPRPRDELQLNTLVNVSYNILRQNARHLAVDRAVNCDDAFLVHEAWLRFRIRGHTRFSDLRQFLRFMRRTMVNILKEIAREEVSRGYFEPLDDAMANTQPDPVLSIALTNVMEDLAIKEPLLCQAVRLRFCQGYTRAEIAQILGVSESTVKRRWWAARTWLARALRRADQDVVSRVKRQPLVLNLTPKPLPPLTN